MPAGIHRFLCPIGLIIGSLKGLNFRRVSAEYFIGFRRVPGQFLSPPSFSTPALLLMLMLLLLLDALLCSSLIPWPALNFRRVSAEYFISFRRVPGQFLSPPFFQRQRYFCKGCLQQHSDYECICKLWGMVRECIEMSRC